MARSQFGVRFVFCRLINSTTAISLPSPVPVPSLLTAPARHPQATPSFLASLPYNYALSSNSSLIAFQDDRQFRWPNSNEQFLSTGKTKWLAQSLRSRLSHLPAANLRESMMRKSPVYLSFRLEKLMCRPPLMLHPVSLFIDRGVTSNANGGGEDMADGAEKTATTWNHNDWVEGTVSSVVDVFASVTKGVLDGVAAATPVVNRFFGNPYLLELLIPLSLYVGACLVLPSILRRLHKYLEQGSATLLQGTWPESKGVSYELSLWGALEDPARLLATLLALSQVGAFVAPTALAGHYLTQVWSAGSGICFIWFLHRWKGNIFIRLLADKKVAAVDRERLLALDKFSSVGLLMVGGLVIAEASGVAIQSLLTVGGIGGVATAFAARDVLGNLLSGLALYFSKPFSVGDNISAGSVEGKVEEMGLHSTRLLNSEKSSIMVPNSFFSSQVIVNKSRVSWRGLSLKIPVHLEDFEKIPIITAEIRKMLMSHSMVYMDEDLPRCYLSRFSGTSSDLLVSCNIKPMSKDDFLMVEQDILLQAARIVTREGAILGGAV